MKRKTARFAALPLLLPLALATAAFKAGPTLYRLNGSRQIEAAFWRKSGAAPMGRRRFGYRGQPRSSSGTKGRTGATAL